MLAHVFVRPMPGLAWQRLPWRAALLTAVCVVGLSMRLLYGRGAPLWLDETFTGVIASQSTVTGLLHWLTTELTGPLFYAPLWAWAKVAGNSDAALRAPSLIWTLAAPLFAMSRGHRDPLMRFSWAALLLLWLPAAPLAADARPYALLLLLGTLQVAALCATLRTPTRRAALGWTATTAAIGFTHYAALIPALAQGLVLVAVHRRAMLRLWPTAIPFVLLAGWMVIHLPFAIPVTAKGAAVCTTLGWRGIAALPTLVCGSSTLALLLFGAFAMDLVGRRPTLAWPRWQPEGLTTIAGISGFALIVGIACVLPGFAPRYLIAAVPTLLFGASWWLANALRRGAPAAAAFLAIAMLGAASLAASSWHDTALDQRHAFELERPSAWLMQEPVDRILFVWTDTNAELAPPDFDANLAEVGGFFFTRAGHRPKVELVHATPHIDVAATVAARLGDDPRTTILWLANVPSPDPLRRPDDLMRRSDLLCRDWGLGLSVAVACRRVTRS